MDRDAFLQLRNWFSSSRRKPLVLRGARQVGKSTLVRLFAEDMGLDLFEINLERYVYLEEVFRSGDLQRVFAELEGLAGTIRNREKSLLFLDEVQAVPAAIAFLRYFYEDVPELPVIAAGSLLEFSLGKSTYSMPVGRITYLHLGPLSFREFLRVIDPDLEKWYRGYRWGDDVPRSRHEKLLERQREYTFCGGMPEAVQVFLETRNMNQVQEVHRSILDTYVDDFGKYARSGDLGILQRIFRSVPLQLGRKVIYRNFSQEDRSVVVKTMIDLLSKARVITQVFHSDCSGSPLGAGRNDGVFKLLFLDCGLLNFQLGLTWSQVYTMGERTLLNEGNLAEQFVGQEILAMEQGMRSPELFYWLREGRSSNAEVDFVIGRAMDIVPIEVKAGKSGTLRSLQQFVLHKQKNLAIRFDLNYPSIQHLTFEGQEWALVSLPLYFAGRTYDVLDELLAP